MRQKRVITGYDVITKTLGDMFADLMGKKGQKPILYSEKIRSASDRISKIKLFFPDMFVNEIEKRSLSWQSWLLNGNADAHGLHKKLNELFCQNAKKIRKIMDEKVYQCLWENEKEMFDRQRLNSLMDLYSKELLKVTKHGKYQKRMEYYIEENTVRALSKLLLLLILGPYGYANLELVFPDEEFSLYFMNGENGGMTCFENTDAKKKYAEVMYYEGQYAISFAVLEQLAEENKDSSVFFQLGKMFQRGDGCKKDDRKAFSYFNRSASENADGCYAVYQCYLNGTGCVYNSKSARIYLEKAYQQGSNKAARDMGMAYYSGNTRLGYSKDLEKAKECFVQGASCKNPEEGNTTCQYMLGKIYEQSFDYKLALICYEYAAKKGYQQALECLWNMDWKSNLFMETSERSRVESAQVKEICFLNSIGKGCQSYLNTLPMTNCRIVVCVDELLTIKSVEDIKEMLRRETGKVCEVYLGSIASYIQRFLENEATDMWSGIRVCLFDESEEKNIADACNIVEKLRIEIKENKKKREYLCKIVEIYLRAQKEIAEWMIDSYLTGMGNNYFKVQICNEFRDAVEWLYSQAPLFLTCIGKRASEKIELIILGDGASVPWLVKNALFLGCASGKEMSILVVSKESEVIENVIRRDCPGLYKNIGSVIEFWSMDLDDCKLQEMFSVTFVSEDEKELYLAAKLKKGRYFIVASDNDENNIKKAMEIRSWCLKYDSDFECHPFIAAYCKDDRLAWQVKRFSIGNERIGYSWYNNFDIYCFGALSQLYSYDRLRNDVLEKRALEVHLSYFETDLTGKGLRKALNSYYSRSYNRDSSRCCALSMIYRAFAEGIYLSNWEDYGSLQGERILANRYEEWLWAGDDKQQEERLEKAAQREHERWNMYMISRGWECATLTQMETYMERGNPSQQLYIAKLHPYICSWEKLGDAESGVQYHINRIMSNINPDAFLYDIKEIDKKSIRMTAQILGSYKSDPEKRKD